jgi:hypothetical protein
MPPIRSGGMRRDTLSAWSLGMNRPHGQMEERTPSLTLAGSAPTISIDFHATVSMVS